MTITINTKVIKKHQFVKHQSHNLILKDSKFLLQSTLNYVFG